MDRATFEKAIDLNNQIKQIQETLDCIELNNEGETYEKTKLILQYYQDGRMYFDVPIDLNTLLIPLIKSNLEAAKTLLTIEFQNL